MEVEVRNILVGMKEELSKGWAQKGLMTEEGVCVYGAMTKAAKLPQKPCFGGGPIQGRSGAAAGMAYVLNLEGPKGRAIKMLAAEVGTTFEELALWNDTPGRTVDEVVDAIDRVLLRDMPLKKNARKRIKKTAVPVAS